MDSDDIQLEPGSAPQQPASDDSAPVANRSSQVFEISDDSILPINNDSFADVQRPAQEQAEPLKRSTPPPEAEMLDRKIGTFDASPFGKPATPPIKPVQPTPAPANVYREEVQQSDLVRGDAIYQVPKTTPPPRTTATQQKPQIPLDEKPVAPIFNQQPKRNLQDEIAAALSSKMKIPTSASLSPKPIPVAPEPVPETSTRNENLVSSALPQNIKPIRTYEGDVAEAMSHKRTSTASIAIAENKKQQGRDGISNEETTHSGRKITMFILSIVLLGGGAYGAYYLYSKSALAPVVPVVSQPKTAPSIIPSDTQSIVTIEIENPLLTLGRVSSEITKPQAPNTIKEIVIATKNQTGVLSRVSGPEMIKALEINTPDPLERSLTQNWMLGVYADPDGTKSVFVVTTTNFFQNAFAGMLQWESVMADDIKQILYPSTYIQGISNESTDKPRPIANPLQNINSILPSVPVASSTNASSTTNGKLTTQKGAIATSSQSSASTTIDTTQPLRQYITIRGKFEDRIVKNKDVRAFRTDTGKTLFLYSFIDNAHLLITDKETTLAEALSRLEKESFIR